MSPKRPKVVPIINPTLFEMGKVEEARKLMANIVLPRPYDIPHVYLGTSAFQAKGWERMFYPKGMKPAEYLTYYSQTFRTVEVDSTFYATPSVETVNRWYLKTPADFIISAKVPQVITHKKVLLDCDAEFDEFIGRMDILDDKLGPMLLQFPYFNKYEFKTGADFLARLRFFLKKLSEMFTYRFVVEIRNKSWLDHNFLQALREHNVALALTDTSFMPRPWELKTPLDLITSDFAYVRWLGNRKEIEKTTTTWDHTIVDRTEDVKHWASLISSLVHDKRIRKVLAYANNHYGGYAPDTAKLFFEMWNR